LFGLLKTFINAILISGLKVNFCDVLKGVSAIQNKPQTKKRAGEKKGRFSARYHHQFVA
jgi:hypothetical protein